MVSERSTTRIVPRKETMNITNYLVIPCLVFVLVAVPLFFPLQVGVASWYGYPFHGRLTASGSIFDKDKLTAAHPTFPFHSQWMVFNPNNGKSVVVKVTDRGPFWGNRIIDLSQSAARIIDMEKCGISFVLIIPVSPTLLRKGEK